MFCFTNNNEIFVSMGVMNFPLLSIAYNRRSSCCLYNKKRFIDCYYLKRNISVYRLIRPSMIFNSLQCECVIVASEQTCSDISYAINNNNKGSQFITYSAPMLARHLITAGQDQAKYRSTTTANRIFLAVYWSHAQCLG